jgi:ER membrane protein complex subunit 1
MYLVDGVTGAVIYSATHKRARGPVHVVHSENWLVYSYFNEKMRRTEVASYEFYEGKSQSNATGKISINHAVDTHTNILSCSVLIEVKFHSAPC